jgi:hypothetical protein
MLKRFPICCVGWLACLLGCTEPQKPSGSEHAVIVHFDYGSKDLGPLFALEDQLISAIDSAGAGEFDGNEIAVDGSDGSLYMYGPNADQLFAVVRPVLEQSTAIRNAVATLRYGPPEDGVKSVEVRLESRH